MRLTKDKVALSINPSLTLAGQVIRVSLETVRIVNSLPPAF
jgi:hypothetical protein